MPEESVIRAYQIKKLDNGNWAVFEKIEHRAAGVQYDYMVTSTWRQCWKLVFGVWPDPPYQHGVFPMRRLRA